MFTLKKNLQNLWVLGALASVAAFGEMTDNKAAQQAQPEVTTNATMVVKGGTHFLRSSKWNDKVEVFETNLVWKATNEPIYFMRNKINTKSSDKLFAQEDYKFESFVEDMLDRGDICERKGTNTTKLKFDKPNNKYPWKTRHGFKEKIFYEGPLSEFPGLNLDAGRVLTDVSGVTNAWNSSESYVQNPAVIHTHAVTNIINEAEKRFISREIDSRKDERKPGVTKMKYGIVTLETKQDAYPQELNEIRQTTVYTIKDLGNGKVQIKGTQKGRNIHVKETNCKVLSDWRKVKNGKINLPFPSSVKKVSHNKAHMGNSGNQR